MGLRQSFIKSIMKEPQKSFYEVGITNSDGLLTAEGAEIFIAYLLEKNKDAFKSEVVDVILKDREDQK